MDDLPPGESNNVTKKDEKLESTIQEKNTTAESSKDVEVDSSSSDGSSSSSHSSNEGEDKLKVKNEEEEQADKDMKEVTKEDSKVSPKKIKTQGSESSSSDPSDDEEEEENEEDNERGGEVSSDHRRRREVRDRRSRRPSKSDQPHSRRRRSDKLRSRRRQRRASDEDDNRRRSSHRDRDRDRDRDRPTDRRRRSENHEGRRVKRREEIDNEFEAELSKAEDRERNKDRESGHRSRRHRSRHERDRREERSHQRNRRSEQDDKSHRRRRRRREDTETSNKSLKGEQQSLPTYMSRSLARQKNLAGLFKLQQEYEEMISSIPPMEAFDKIDDSMITRIWGKVDEQREIWKKYGSSKLNTFLRRYREGDVDKDLCAESRYYLTHGKLLPKPPSIPEDDDDVMTLEGRWYYGRTGAFTIKILKAPRTTEESLEVTDGPTLQQSTNKLMFTERRSNRMLIGEVVPSGEGPLPPVELADPQWTSILDNGKSAVWIRQEPNNTLTIIQKIINRLSIKRTPQIATTSRVVGGVDVDSDKGSESEAASDGEQEPQQEVNMTEEQIDEPQVVVSDEDNKLNDSSPPPPPPAKDVPTQQPPMGYKQPFPYPAGTMYPMPPMFGMPFPPPGMMPPVGMFGFGHPHHHHHHHHHPGMPPMHSLHGMAHHHHHHHQHQHQHHYHQHHQHSHHHHHHHHHHHQHQQRSHDQQKQQQQPIENQPTHREEEIPPQEIPSSELLKESSALPLKTPPPVDDSLDSDDDLDGPQEQQSKDVEVSDAPVSFSFKQAADPTPSTPAAALSFSFSLSNPTKRINTTEKIASAFGDESDDEDVEVDDTIQEMARNQPEPIPEPLSFHEQSPEREIRPPLEVTSASAPASGFSEQPTPMMDIGISEGPLKRKELETPVTVTSSRLSRSGKVRKRRNRMDVADF